jgi:hypothetical protein
MFLNLTAYYKLWTSYRPNDQGISILFWAGAEFFSSPQCPAQLRDLPIFLFSRYLWDSFPVRKAAELYLCSPFVFMVWCLIKQGDNFTITVRLLLLTYCSTLQIHLCVLTFYESQLLNEFIVWWICCISIESNVIIVMFQ